MKSWADHCSSDDESDEEAVVSDDEETHTPQPGHNEDDNNQESEHSSEPIVKPKEYSLPTEPPFKAYVGNVSFVIKESKQLGQEITKLCLDRFQDKIKVVRCQVAQDQHTGQLRGFGYVEVETLEMLQQVLKLNDGNSQIGGRKIHLDVAQFKSVGSNRSTPGGSDRSLVGSGRGGGPIDGSSFRAGRYNYNANDSKSNGPPRSPMQREEIGGETSVTLPTAALPAQRTSLKLKPRSQGRDDSSTAKSEIFGGGKKQDAGEWEQRRKNTTKESHGQIATKEPHRQIEAKEPRRQSESKEQRRPSETKETRARGDAKEQSVQGDSKIAKDNSAKNNEKNERRQSGRGGRGGVTVGRNSHDNGVKGGRGGRTGGRGASKDGKKSDAPKPAIKAPIPIPAPPAKSAEIEKKPKVVNKFAALAFGDDSDSD